MKYETQISSLSKNFTGRIDKRNLAIQTRKVFNKNFPALLSPSYIEAQSSAKIEGDIFYQLIEDIKSIRQILNAYIKNKNSNEYFDWLLKLVKFNQVANCSECAEITDTILKINKFKNSDIFHLYAKSKDGKIRFLDHTVTAIGVKKQQNNKQFPIIFKPNKNVTIIDMWYNSPKGLVVKFLHLKERLKKLLKIKDNEELMLKPVKNLQLDEQTISRLRQDYPNLIF